MAENCNEANMFHINTYFNEITWSDIVDVGHAAYYIFTE